MASAKFGNLTRSAWDATFKDVGTASLVSALAVALTPPVILWVWRPDFFPWTDALNDLLKIVIWVGTIALALALRFLWNLWLAPYRETTSAIRSLEKRLSEVGGQVAHVVAHFETMDSRERDKLQKFEELWYDKAALIGREQMIHRGTQSTEILNLVDEKISTLEARYMVKAMHLESAVSAVLSKIGEAEASKE